MTPIIKKPSTVEKDEVKTDFEILLDNFELTICIICGEEVEAYWEARYRGMRASCKKCKINWAES